MEATTRQLVDESVKRQHFEQELHDSHVELASYRNTALTAEREIAKAAAEIKARDAEIALLRSRENKTVVEHVHVLEQAKKVTDRQLAEQVKENSRLNQLLKINETQRHRLVADYEDANRQIEILKAGNRREARTARASLSPEDKDAVMVLEDERKARRLAESRIASLEQDLQDQRRQLSTATMSAANVSAAEARLTKKEEEFWRLAQAHEDGIAENSRLQRQLADLQRSARPPTTPKMGDYSRTELLRGLQQSHDALGRDMTDQLRKLDAQPLTPSRRHNAPPNGMIASTGDPMTSKRMRQLETEVSGLRNQLDDEREEKSFLMQRLKDLEGGEDGDKSPFPFEQAVYSHFRLKAKSLRTQLDQ